ncbi:tetraprenyl-beta-curcumene synthase family protein [Alicyclobacillus pomorum]|uniref:tetraprenyl-beta-curcumene synthase family protein n=1 Tax=Alicyclobacillus pomorum TaxID=204470 RepID=UPI000478CD95|nr:tetraprenyl-beta-curcumene synthase family protein [Alicyclobacillus pomorum]
MQARHAPKTATQFLYRCFRHILPIARQELITWTGHAERIPDDMLRTQALASLQHKRFHADGGSVYAAVRLQYAKPLTRLIIALQTISDYLDNLCDRCHTYDEADFVQLHHAMRDAVRPEAPLRDYYALRGSPDDGGYLTNLVQTCQTILSSLPGYAMVREHVEWLVERYCELQAIKHVEPTLRKDKLVRWWKPYRPQFPDIHWWEFAAATGSTLGMFSLFLAATTPLTEAEARQLFDIYFPWVCGLHILLDYLIDLEEDRSEGDFNFVACYPSAGDVEARIRLFAETSHQKTRQVGDGLRIHHDVVHGLLGMYLSDDKVRQQKAVRNHRRLVWQFGPTAWMYYGACMLYRFVR